MENVNKKFGKTKIRTKIIFPTIIVLVLSNLISVFTSAYKMDDLAKNNAKLSLEQLTDSIFLNLRTGMNTGDVTIIEEVEKKSRENIQGLEKFVVAKGENVIQLFTPLSKYTTDEETLKVFASKQKKIIESFDNGKHTIRSLNPMIAKQECLFCHVNQQVGDVIGVLDLTFNLKDSDAIINNTVINLILQAILVLVLITTFMTWLIRRATKPIDVFQRGLEMFFRYINKEEKDVGYIDGYSNDEIGDLVDSVNRNIDATVQGVHKDEQVIEEAKDVCQKAALGIYDVQIKSEAHSGALNDLKQLVNKLISSSGENVQKIADVLNSFEYYDYTNRIQTDDEIKGTMKNVFDKVNVLGATLMKGATTNAANGEKLQEDAITLENVTETIQKFLNQQSSELQNSTNELQQITQLIRDTTNNAISMQSYANNVTRSVEEGQNLANQTASEMDEISQQVIAINEAITIIDQIAFQTNILSLNAAVEAATAGEAGKGFAVVAQEVRNLANRSADAAKEIKDLVEQATLKANEGKAISDKMKQGYTELNEHINSTITLIQNVTKASQSQQNSIEQIGAQISVIQEHTVQSTQMAKDASEIATHTREMASAILTDANEKKFV